MWILRRDADELTEEDLEVLKWLFKHSPLLELAYKLCNELTAIFEGVILKVRRSVRSTAGRSES